MRARAGIAIEQDGLLFRATDKKDRRGCPYVGSCGLQDAYWMIRRQIKIAGLGTWAGHPTFRETVLTAYLRNNGLFDHDA